MKSSRKTNREGRHGLAVVLTAAALSVSFALFLVPRGWAVPPATTGTGNLTVNNNATICPSANGSVGMSSNGTGPSTDIDWYVLQDKTIHINIAPSYPICQSGNAENPYNNIRCTTDNQCDWSGTCALPTSPAPTCDGVQTGTCEGTSSKTCSNTGSSCRNDTDCTVAGTCSNTGASCTSATDCEQCSNTGAACKNNPDCTVNGTCTSGVLECSGSTDVVINGHDGNACTTDSQCTADNETGCDTGEGLCKFTDSIATTVGSTTANQIDVCYTTKANNCDEAQVVYCGNHLTNGYVSGSIYVEADLQSVSTNTETTELNTPEECTPGVASCTNLPGSFCCGLTQGAYGAPNSVATASSNSCSAPGLGFIPDAACQGCNVFYGEPNATTIGSDATNSVAIGNETTETAIISDPTLDPFATDLNTLIAYLPASGRPNTFNPHYVSGDVDYTSPSQIPDLSGSGSKGQGGGALSGQTMACAINSFLSACTPPFGGSKTFTASGFGGFTLPKAGTLVCTKRAGEDKVLGTSEDICQAFLYPTCVAEQTVADVKKAADQQLSGGSNDLNCSASDLTAALDNINSEFDQCGEVIDCGAQSTPGVFACPLPPG